MSWEQKMATYKRRELEINWKIEKGDNFKKIMNSLKTQQEVNIQKKAHHRNLCTALLSRCVHDIKIAINSMII